jgi:hypothetical protein
MIRLRVLNDTVMLKIPQNQKSILGLFLKTHSLSLSEVHEELNKDGNEISLL